MNFRRFEIFKAIMESSTLTEAASRMNLTQPAATKALRLLEDDLGLELFDRKRGRLHPTSDAQDLYEYLEDVFHRLAALKTFATERRELRRGHIVIASNTFFSSLLLPTIIRTFSEKYPGVTLAIQAHASHRVHEMVENGMINIGIATSLHPSDSIHSSVLFRMPGVCVLPLGHPLGASPSVSWSDLAGVPFISTSDLDKSRGLIAGYFGPEAARMNVVCEVSQAYDACLLVEQGIGVTIVNEATAREFLETCHVRPLDGVLSYEISLLIGRSRPLSTAERGFLKHLRASAQAAYDQALSRPIRKPEKSMGL